MDRVLHVIDRLDLAAIPTPCFVCAEELLQHNLDVLGSVQARSGCRILLALKGFAMHSMFPQVRRVLAGVCASSPDEARLGRELFGGEVHAFAPAYSDSDIAELTTLADHIIFNSFAQWRRYRPVVAAAPRPISCGIRINPEYSEVEVDLYNPCAPNSRLGVTRSQFDVGELAGISGLHFHTLCEQNATTLEKTLAAVEGLFGDLLGGMAWLNFGGGHHITRDDYDIDLLCRLITTWRERYGVRIYLEPGEAVALNAGFLVTSVLDIVENGMAVAILDTSASAHLPDVLEMPYRPHLHGAGEAGQFAHTYRLGGLTCLAGDIIGDYSFPAPLCPGDKLVFLDMAHYTMVKTTTFNGIRLPSIAVLRQDDERLDVVRRFGYEDYRDRLS